MLEYIGNAITRLPMDETWLSGRIQPTPLLQNCFLGIGRYCQPHSERSGFVGCRDQKHPQFWWNLDDFVPLWFKKIKSGRKTANINTKKP